MKRGFSLVEIVVGAALLAIVSIAMYQSYASVMIVTRGAGDKLDAIELANEQIEILHNLPYQSVGIIGGIPAGVVTESTTTVRDGNTFRVTTTIRNVDDPSDGIFPTDPAEADYKLAQISVDCSMCKKFTPIALTTTIAPKNLETTTNNGALKITVRDASAQPVQGAQVTIVNTAVSPNLNFFDVTNAQGVLTIYDVKPSSLSYALSTTKDNYSTDKTYKVTSDNPTPTVRDATVSAGQTTGLSFYIDRTASPVFQSVNTSCVPQPNFPFMLRGNKTIGTKSGLPVYKYFVRQNTGATGSITVPNLEWDNYTITSSSTTYDLGGALPIMPIAIAPASTATINLTVYTRQAAALLLDIKDTATKLPVSGATVTLTGNSVNLSKSTGVGVLEQTDWSGGAGQANYTDQTKFYDSDGNISITPAGQISLLKTFSTYAPSGWLTSSSFDLGIVASLYNVKWNPVDVPAGVGANAVRMQIAANTDNTTWNYIGPDGTASTYYTLAQNSIGSELANNRYFRYKVLLQTASSTLTPSVTDVQFQYTTACTPSGEVLFQGLTKYSSPNYYTATISAPGYTTAIANDILVSDDWQQRLVYITHQ
ncbi:MAG: prepilin-type N-terminal cleavage/methylation domain-containing protein [Candidatus Paceibacterota bacterium]|jgi:prepilin-type N-terminal cleavage/methylation domain-containing protein